MITTLFQNIAVAAAGEGITINLGEQAIEQEIPYATAGWDTAAGAGAAFGALLGSISNIVLIIGTVAVLLYLFWGAIEWITAGGDKGKVEKAREKMTQAIIGLVVLVSSAAILLFVQQLLGICVIDFNGNKCKNVNYPGPGGADGNIDTPY